MDMQRPLKFRAFDRKSKRFVYGQLTGSFFDASFNPDFSSHQEDGKALESMDLTPWEQWCGLLDSHGREMYEGDILKQDFDGQRIIGVFTFNKQRAQFGMDAMVHSEFPKDYVEIKTSQHPLPEVIGNIHLNAYLLD